jgi:hypothetical protein
VALTDGSILVSSRIDNKIFHIKRLGTKPRQQNC